MNEWMNIFLIAVEPGKSVMEVPAGSVSVEGLLPGLSMADCSCRTEHRGFLVFYKDITLMPEMYAS